MKDEESLRVYRIRVMTYKELIDNAESAYAKFLEATAKAQDLTVLLDEIRNYVPDTAIRESSADRE